MPENLGRVSVWEHVCACVRVCVRCKRPTLRSLANPVTYWSPSLWLVLDLGSPKSNGDEKPKNINTCVHACVHVYTPPAFKNGQLEWTCTLNNKTSNNSHIPKSLSVFAWSAIRLFQSKDFLLLYSSRWEKTTLLKGDFDNRKETWCRSPNDSGVSSLEC